MTKFQKIAAIVLLTVAIGVALYEGKQAHDARNENQNLQSQQAPLTNEIGELQASLASMTNQLASLQAENSRLKKNSDGTELLQLKSEVARLRPLPDEVAALQKTLNQSSTGLAQWKTNELANVGCATPFDALQTYLYSSRPDPPDIKNSFVGDDVDPPTEEALQKFIEIKTKHSRGLVDMDIVSYKILSQNWLTADKVKVKLEIMSPGGVGFLLPITLRKVDSEWKLVAFNIRDQHGAVRDVELINEAPNRSYR